MRYPVGKDKSDFDANWKIDQGFGNPTTYGFHEGCDFNLKTGGNTDLGQPMYAICDGEVTSVHDHTTGFGKHLHIKHVLDGKEYYSHYAHCQEIKVVLGQVVKEGEIVALLGSTGNSTLAHLHFAIKNQPTGIDGIAKVKEDLLKWEDPIVFLDKWMKMPTIDENTKISLPAPWNEISVKDILSNLNSQKTTIEAMSKAKEDYVTEISALRVESQGWKTKYETRVATDAKKLGVTQDEPRIDAELDRVIADSEKLRNIKDDRPITSATPVHKLLEEILAKLKLLLKKKRA